MSEILRENGGKFIYINKNSFLGEACVLQTNVNCLIEGA